MGSIGSSSRIILYPGNHGMITMDLIMLKDLMQKMKKV